MQIEVTTRLTTCCYYRFEGGEFSDPLKSFMLLLSACLVGLDEFSGGEGVIGIPSIQACSVFRHNVASVCGRFLRGAGLTRKRFVLPIRQNGSERKGGAERFAGCYLLSVAAVFQMNGNCVHATPAISLLFHLHPYCS